MCQSITNLYKCGCTQSAFQTCSNSEKKIKCKTISSTQRIVQDSNCSDYPRCREASAPKPRRLRTNSPDIESQLEVLPRNKVSYVRVPSGDPDVHRYVPASSLTSDAKKKRDDDDDDDCCLDCCPGTPPRPKSRGKVDKSPSPPRIKIGKGVCGNCCDTLGDRRRKR